MLQHFECKEHFVAVAHFPTRLKGFTVTTACFIGNAVAFCELIDTWCLFLCFVWVCLNCTFIFISASIGDRKYPVSALHVERVQVACYVVIAQAEMNDCELLKVSA